MGRTITQLEVQKKNKKRVSVYLDDVYAFGLSIMIAARLFTGQVLSGDQIESLIEEDLDSRAYEAAVRFLGYRARSITEMSIYLAEKKFPESSRKKAVTRLVNAGYLNDREFARMWIDDRLRLNPKGTFMLRMELRQKGIDDGLIDEALVDYNEEEAARTALGPRLPKWQKLPEEALKKKIYSFLSQRGFSYETTLAMVDWALYI